jgi:hypothetical protein
VPAPAAELIKQVHLAAGKRDPNALRPNMTPLFAFSLVGGSGPDLAKANCGVMCGRNPFGSRLLAARWTCLISSAAGVGTLAGAGRARMPRAPAGVDRAAQVSRAARYAEGARARE